MRYSLFDQYEKLGEPPWSGPALKAWEKAHGHDVRLKCYPEFGCAVLGQAWDRLRDAAQALVAEAVPPGEADLKPTWRELIDALAELEHT